MRMNLAGTPVGKAVAVSQFRVRAPELTGRGGWLNTAEPLSLRQVRGKVVILDFWTFCCANCLHVLDELRPLEDKYRDVLVVVGVHSPKFVHEADHAAVVNAVERYEVHHPVLDDPDLNLWRQYAVRAWPTLVVVDPEGYVVAQAAGEGQVSALDRIVGELVATHEAKGTLGQGDPRRRPPAGRRRGASPDCRAGPRRGDRPPAYRHRRARSPRRPRATVRRAE